MTKILTIACSTLGNRLSDAIDVYQSLHADAEKIDFLIFEIDLCFCLYHFRKK